MDFHDPNGKVFCEGCQKLGRPKGGVTFQRQLNKVHVSYELPEGWLFTNDGELLCTPCGKGVEAVVFIPHEMGVANTLLAKGKCTPYAGPAQGYVTEKTYEAKGPRPKKRAKKSVAETA